MPTGIWRQGTLPTEDKDAAGLFAKRGEVWLVDFSPTVGSEIGKRRPAVIVSSDALGHLPVKLVAPLTHWRDGFLSCQWQVQVLPDKANGLARPSSVDVLQLRAADVRRFVERLGWVSAALMDEIAAAVALVVEYR